LTFLPAIEFVQQQETKMKRGEKTLCHLLAPIQDLLDNPMVTEIVVNKLYEVGWEANGCWYWREVPEFGFDYLDALGILAGSMTASDLSPEHPMCITALPGRQRIRIIRPPVTEQGNVVVCIRNPPARARTFDDADMDDLVSDVNEGDVRRSQTSRELIDLYHQRDWKKLLPLAVKARKSIGAVGITGSGKSDFLRRCVGACEERTVSIEASPEIGNDVGPRNKVALFYNQLAKGRMAVDVVQATLQLYPKTIVFQEVTGKESFALMRSGLSGHQILTSWHAEVGDEITAMAGMLRQSDEMMTSPLPELRAMVRRVFDFIITFERSSTEDGEKFRLRRIWFRDIEESNGVEK
jgi:type IV secretory pathway ATPase VirB11/archaellum biosynthesis ATPase